MRREAIIFWCWLGLLGIRAQAHQSTSAGGGPGERLYEEHCAPCHGAHGYDGFAANLAVPRLPNAPDDRALIKLIKNGFDGTDMTPAFGVTDSEVSQIVAYVRTLGRTSPKRVPGDPGRGRQVYRTKADCAQCHMVSGEGGRQGPDLTEIGARRSPSHLRESIVDPDANLPHDFLLVQATTNEGRKITGIRLNEDSFSIQIRGLAGSIHSLWKSEISDLRKDWGKSSMPSYRSQLTAAEIDDLVAYLVSLRGDL